MSTGPFKEVSPRQHKMYCDMGKCLGEDWTTVVGCILTFNMGKFVSLYFPGDAEFFRNKMPKSLLEAANIWRSTKLQGKEDLSSPDIDIVMANANHTHRIDG